MYLENLPAECGRWRFKRTRAWFVRL